MHMSDISKGALFTLASLFANAFVPLLSQWAMKSFMPLDVALFISILNVLYCLLWHLKWPIFNSHTSFNQYFKSAMINAVGIICLYISLSYLDPITFAFISVFYVVFSVLISTFILREGRSPLEILAIMVGILGAFFLSAKGSSSLASWVGIGLVMLDTFCFAVANYLVKSASPSLNPVAVLFFNNLVCSIILMLWLAKDMGRIYSMNIQPAHAFGLLAASVCAFAAVGLIFASYRLLSFRLSSLIRAMKPLVSTGVALPFASAELSFSNWFGAFLLFTSIIIIVSKERKV